MAECIVCRNGSLKPYSDQIWSIWGVNYKLVACSTCCSISTDPMPSDDVLVKVYDECFDYRWYQDHYSAKLRDCRERIREYRPHLGNTVLDFGGGVGYLSEALKAHGYVSRTYDPFCRRDDQKEGKWDTVIALHVLEHANDPDRTVMEMRELLQPDGGLIIAVPNAGGRGYSDLGTQWVWAQPPLLHTLHFTAAGLTSLLKRHGFTVDDVRYAERWDANLYTDLDKVSFFRMLDQAWGRPHYNRYAIYRKGCAAVSSFLRFRGLRKAMQSYDPSNADYSELQVVARLAEKS